MPSKSTFESRYTNRYTGIFRELAPVASYAFDPQVFLYGATLWKHPSSGEKSRKVGGAGWTLDEARYSCLGEGIERSELRPYPGVRTIIGTYRHFPVAECVLSPESWILFSNLQYQSPGFPFERYAADTELPYVCFRRRAGGEPVWIPEHAAFLLPRQGEQHRFCPVTSTGLVAETDVSKLVLRGTQEWVERDALIGAWWGLYAVEEWDEDLVLSALPADLPRRIRRQNLRYRYFRVHSPYSQTVAVVLVEGDDLKCRIMSFGSACRETLASSWKKALLESLQTRVYVRGLTEEPPDAASLSGSPEDFGAHAAYYSRFRERLPTPLFPVTAPTSEPALHVLESVQSLEDSLGEKRPILFRLGDSPCAADGDPRWHVARVVVPGMLVLHGDHRFPHLGFSDQSRSGFAHPRTVPHPFA